MKNLQDITRQESGLVLYETGELLLLNWSGINGIPRLSPFGNACLGMDEELTVLSEISLDDIGFYLDGYVDGFLNLIYTDSDEEDISGQKGKLYKITTSNESDGVVEVFAPLVWN